MADSLITACKCHGVSASCAIKTCWKSLSDFDSIGAILKSKYYSAAEVKRRRRKQIKVFVPIHSSKDRILEDDLIIYTKSPDYCSPDRKTGSIGTHGR